MKEVGKKIIVKKARVSNRTRIKKPLIIASGSACFWVHNGPILCHLLDLHRCLETIKPEQYNYHVGRLGNDFARWVRQVLRDDDCGQALVEATSATEAHQIVTKCLKKYSF
ncbi:MAG: hypothetical protein AAB468_01995 [Patescibacteria group bacterium]